MTVVIKNGVITCKECGHKNTVSYNTKEYDETPKCKKCGRNSLINKTAVTE